MKILFLLCAESAAIDNARNTLSLFHIIEEFNSPSFPFVIPSLFICALLEKPLDEPEPEGLEIRLAANERELLVNPVPLQFNDKLRMRAVTGLGGLIVQTPGSLTVSITQGTLPLATWRIPINSIGEPKIQTELPLGALKPDTQKTGDQPH
jgi:hypothetical protein